MESVKDSWWGDLMEIGACSHIGKIREVNEDAFYIEQDHQRLFIVADGMGGHNAGEIASSTAIESIVEYIRNNWDDLDSAGDGKIYEMLKAAILNANHKILERSIHDTKCQGMGTTLTLAFVLSKIYIGHVGDSRAYIISKEKITQITQDHSLVAELVRNGSITEKEAKSHPQRNIITRALGTDVNTMIDIYSTPFTQGDIVLLCTDGLTNLVEPIEILECMIHSRNIQQGCEHLVELANERGGNDNITVLAIKNIEE